MCTISWFYHSDGYELFFNRDEAKTRSVALPPRIFCDSQDRADTPSIIMPIDPQGQGTWLAVNDLGMCFALLNFYQGRLPKGSLRSRGQIVKNAAMQPSMADAEMYIESLDLQRYAPFSLLLFAPQSNVDGVTCLCWDGKTLGKRQQYSPLFSSAVRFEEIKASRQAVYAENIGEIDAIAGSTIARQIDAFKRLHMSHLPGKSAESICMHRDDAETVSFSHISVAGGSIQYDYYPSAPCSTHTIEISQVVLPKR